MCTTFLITHLMIARRLLAAGIYGVMFLLISTTSPKFLEADLFEPAIKDISWTWKHKKPKTQ